MAWNMDNQSSYITRADLLSMGTDLKSVPGIPDRWGQSKITTGPAAVNTPQDFTLTPGLVSGGP